MQQISNPKIGWISAGAIVVANMIGTGAFTTLGLQLNELQNSWTILAVWTLGGLFALLGAFSYAELGTRLPRSGGEYNFLTHIYHPALGYLSGWVSLTVGFAASIALSAMAMGAYISKFIVFNSKEVAMLAILVISFVHSFNIRQSSLFQNAFTLLKVLLIGLLIVVALFTPSSSNAFEWGSTWQQEVTRPAFAVSLIYVTYAFSGWNSAAYIVDEIRYPIRNLPKALIGGTLLVCLLYLLLQFSFLNQATIPELRGKVEIGQIVAEMMFGPAAGKLLSIFIALLLVASISAMIWVGPRVTRAMADDYHIWQFFAKDNRFSIPVRAIWLQTFISIVMVMSSSFEQVLLYSGFILQLFTTITVAGVIVLRWKYGKGRAYNSPLYPWAQIVYLVFSLFVLTFLVIDRPFESLMGLTNLVVGSLSYWWSLRFGKQFRNQV